jgi:predicted RNA-binding protein YlxR (DUF448 family)
VTRGGRTKTKVEAERRCIVTGEVQPKSGLIRFVIGPDNQIAVDIAGKLPGRGIWITADRDALDKAVNKKLFARAAKQAVQTPAELVVEVEKLLTRRVVNLLSLARKSGDAITGFEKVKDAVVTGSVAVLLQARDGSEAQKGKIRPPKGEKSLISCLFGHELGLAFGRENVIHAALAAGGLQRRIVEEAARLAGVRNGPAPIGAKEGVKDE